MNFFSRLFVNNRSRLRMSFSEIEQVYISVVVFIYIINSVNNLYNFYILLLQERIF